MRALSIRQPYAELILRGIKTVEYRSCATKIIGEEFFIYAARKLSVVSGQWSVRFADNIVAPTERLPDWMLELAEQVGMIEPASLLPTGVLVGSARICRCEAVASSQLSVVSETVRGTARRGRSLATTRLSSPKSDNSQLTTMYAWHLTDVRRATKLRKPTGHPQPVWFKPF